MASIPPTRSFVVPFVGGYVALEGREVVIQETSCWTWILPAEWFVVRAPVELVTAYYIEPVEFSEGVAPAGLRLRYDGAPWQERWGVTDQYLVEDFAEELKRRRWQALGELSG